MRGFRLILASLFLFGALATAVAQKASPADVEKAKALYLSATKHFDLAEYKEALADYKEAYRLKDDPVFLYNIAQCYRKLNDNQEAVTFYKNYLRRSPDASNRDEVEGKIKTLEDAIAVDDKAKSQIPTGPLEPGSTKPPEGEGEGKTHLNTQIPEPPPLPPEEHHTPIYKKWWLWTAVGAVVVTGVVIGVAASSSSSAKGTAFPGVLVLMRRLVIPGFALAAALAACGGSSDLPDPCKGNAAVCISLTVKSSSVSKVDTLRITASGAVTGSHDSVKGSASELPIKLAITLGAPVTGSVNFHVVGVLGGSELGSGDGKVNLTGAAGEHAAVEVTLSGGVNDGGPGDGGGDGGLGDGGPDANLMGCTDVGCGGTCTMKCALGKHCLAGSDCTSTICNARTHLCGANACDNGIKDPGETDIDCGGTTCNRCDGNLHCAATTDCISNVCSDTYCQLASGGDPMNGRPLWSPGPPIPQHLAAVQDPTYVGRSDHAQITAAGNIWIIAGEGFKSGTGQTGGIGATWVADFSAGVPAAMTRGDDVGLRDPARAALGTDNNIYLFGGFAGLNPSPATVRHPATPVVDGLVPAWATDTPMPMQRTSYAVANGDDGKIYLFGDISQIDVFTPSAPAGTWAQAGQLKAPLRRNLAAVNGGNGFIYLLGGTDSATFGPLATNQAFEVATQSFVTTDPRPLPSARAGTCAVTAPDGRIYVIGGSGAAGTDLALVEAYTPSTNTWTTVHALTLGRNGCAASIAPDGRIVVTGGGIVAPSGYTDQTEIYGPGLSVSPTSGLRGSTVQLIGQNFASSASVKVFWVRPRTACRSAPARRAARAAGASTPSPSRPPARGRSTPSTTRPSTRSRSSSRRRTEPVPEVRQIGRQRALQREQRAGLRVREVDAVGVQGVAFEHEQRAQLVGPAAVPELREGRVAAGAVELVADQRQADVREVGADLVLAAGQRHGLDQAVAGAAPEHPPARLRRQPARARQHLDRDALARGQRQRLVDQALVVGRGADAHREVALVHLAAFERALHACRGCQVPGHHDDPAGLTVQAVRRVQLLVGIALAEELRQRVEVVLGRRVHREQRRLVDHQQRLVLIDDAELGWRVGLGLGRAADHELVADGHGRVRLHAASARPLELRLDDALDARAREARDLLLQEQIDAQAVQLRLDLEVDLDDVAAGADVAQERPPAAPR